MTPELYWTAAGVLLAAVSIIGIPLGAFLVRLNLRLTAETMSRENDVRILRRDLEHDSASRARHEAIFRGELDSLERDGGTSTDRIIARLDTFERNVGDRLVRLETKMENKT